MAQRADREWNWKRKWKLCVLHESAQSRNHVALHLSLMRRGVYSAEYEECSQLYTQPHSQYGIRGFHSGLPRHGTVHSSLYYFTSQSRPYFTHMIRQTGITHDGLPRSGQCPNFQLMLNPGKVGSPLARRSWPPDWHGRAHSREVF